MDESGIAFAGAVEQARLIRAGDLSAAELVRICLARIQRLDPRLNAFSAVRADEALAEAAGADERLRKGGSDADGAPLLGVPVAIKEDLHVRGLPTTKGTNAVALPATFDSEVVRRLRGAGAIVIGKTHAPELCIWPFTESATYGVTRNPWNADRTPGGSSGGSAAAVAAGIVAVAQGSDGGGSIRIPAACTGLFGLKPQRGRVPYAPDPIGWGGLSTVGPLARSVADAALIYDVIAGPVAGDTDAPPDLPRSFSEFARSTPERMRIAVSVKPPIPTPVDSEMVATVRRVADRLSNLGHAVTEEDPPYGQIANLFVGRYLRGIRNDYLDTPGRRRLERRTKAMAAAGAAIPQALIERMRPVEGRHLQRLASFFERHDMLLTPTLAKSPLRVGAASNMGALRTFLMAASFVPFTGVWNLTGQPAAAIPAGLGADGLPLSIQLVGRPRAEGDLLSVAAELEAQEPWVAARPPIA